jgi:hypothetical protein
MRARAFASLSVFVILAGAAPAAAHERFVDESIFFDDGAVIVHRPFVNNDVVLNRVERPKREIIIVPSGAPVVVRRGSKVILPERATGLAQRDRVVVITRHPRGHALIAPTFPHRTVIIQRGHSTFGSHSGVMIGGRRR